MKYLDIPLFKTVTIFRIFLVVIEKPRLKDLELSGNSHIVAICSRREEADDSIFGVVCEDCLELAISKV